VDLSKGDNLSGKDVNSEVSEADSDHLLESMWAFQQGDGAAFNVLYAGMWTSVYGRARKMGLRPDEADEIAQKVMVRVYLYAGRAQIDSNKRLWGWVYTIATREVYKQWKRRRPELIADEDLEHLGSLQVTAGDDPATSAVETETLRDVEQCLDRLDEADRLYVLGPLVHGLTFRQAAALHGLTLGQFKHRYESALAAVRECMRGKGHDFPGDSAHGLA